MTEKQWIKPPVEIRYAKELKALKENDTGPRPLNWQLSPKAVRTFILGSSKEIPYSGGACRIRKKYFGNDALVERSIVTLAGNRGLMLVGEPGTAKTMLSELLSAAISGVSTNTIQGTAGTTEDMIKYSWNYALLLAKGPVREALVPSPLYTGMEKGILTRFEEITRTPAEIQDSLIKAVQRHPNIEVIENQFAVEILTQHHLGVTVTRQTPDIKCYGAYILDPKTGKVDTYLAKVTLMATGGVGAVYKTTTNPLVATGDGIAMVYRAKGTVKDMEFVQFHPTALYHPGDRPSFLITEAMRGYGGVLRTMDGKEFMQKYDPRLSLAPRDIVARAIDNEMKNRGDDHVYLDVTHKDPEETKKHFPNIYEKCLSLGIDITKDYIPVAPAAHYLCGGILVDLNGQSSIERLYAVGECSCTGLHGGNRLASNSLIEAVVYADAAAKHSLRVVDQYAYNEAIPEWNDEGTRSPEEMVLITQSMKEVNQIMSTYVGIVRSDLRLKRAWDRLDIIYEETESLFKRSVASREICELRNMVNVGYLIMRQAMERKESRGLHYTIDYPHAKK